MCMWKWGFSTQQHMERGGTKTQGRQGGEGCTQGQRWGAAAWPPGLIDRQGWAAEGGLPTRGC